MTDREFLGGRATLLDGTHVHLSADEARVIVEACEAADAKRRESMPDSMAALRTLHDALTRLRDEGWRDGIYCPKDGLPFALIEFGSTGVFEGSYCGEWPSGSVMFSDGLVNPRGLLWKPIDHLTEAEAKKLRECTEAERVIWDREIRSLMIMDQEGETKP